MRVLLLPVVLSLAACASQPDLRLAALALERGDRADAEAQYRALADFGLPEAKIALGDLVLDGPANDTQRVDAEALYTAAAERDARGLGRIGKLRARDPLVPLADVDGILDALVQRHGRGDYVLAGDIADLLLARGGRRNMPEVATWSARAAAVGDPRGDYLLGALCDQPLRDSVDVECARRHYRAAAPAMPEAAAALIVLAQRFPAEQPPLALAREAAQWHQGAARFAVYRVYRDKVGAAPQLGVAEVLLRDLFPATPVAAATPAVPGVFVPADAAVELARACAANSGEEARVKLLALLDYLRIARPLDAALIEADMRLAGNLAPVDPEAARALLQPQATASADAAFALAGLYRSGMLDEPDYLTAARWYETAGEGGLGKSWFVLTRLFLYSPGLAPDRVRAEGYAARARAAGYGSVDALLDSAPPATAAPAAEGGP